jgi:Fur family ferric uptake transcriptional regulator
VSYIRNHNAVAILLQLHYDFKKVVADEGLTGSNEEGKAPMVQDKTARKWARQTIQAVGLRATTARLVTLLVLRDSSAPLTHAEVSARLAEHEIDKSTIFRNLNDMVSAKLLRRSELGDHVWRFEIVTEEKLGHTSHPHFVCVDCGSVSCMQEIKLTNKSRAASISFGHVQEILLRGHCNDCVYDLPH